MSAFGFVKLLFYDNGDGSAMVQVSNVAESEHIIATPPGCAGNLTTHIMNLPASGLIFWGTSPAMAFA